MANGYNKGNGDVIAYETYNKIGYFVVHDRSKSEPYTQERANNRWKVFFVPKDEGPKGLEECYRSEGAAKVRAVQCSKFYDPFEIFPKSI